MKKIVKATHVIKIEFEIDENSDEFRKILQNYKETIDPAGKLNDMLMSIVNTYYIYNNTFIKGVGDLQKIKTIKTDKIDGYTDFEVTDKYF